MQRDQLFKGNVLSVGVFLLFCIFALPGDAQDYPTVDSLEALTIPANDPIDLARRLRGVDAEVVRPAEPPIWTLGDGKLFNVFNSAIQQEQMIQADLRAMSDNVLLWVQSGVVMDSRMAQQFVEIVDTAIVQQVQDVWDVVEPPGVDGDTRLYILMVTGLDTAIAGYFADVHAFPRSVLPNSNQHEMMILNLSAIGTTDILNPNILTIIAHEYQHVLRHFIDRDEETWLDEGFSSFTEHTLGWSSNRSQVVSFLNQPDVQVNQWVSDSRRFPRYGAVFLLVNYLAEQYGLEVVRQLSDEPLDGWYGLDAVLRDVGGTTADEFFADWTLANYFLNDDTGYGYATLSRDLPSARPIASIVSYPYTVTGRTPQYSTDYYTAVRFGDADTMTINLTQGETIGLFPAQPYDGNQVAYAVPNDYADVKLTRSFDLTDVETATLSFRTWYDLEAFWDYGYVMVSTDDGATWEILSGVTTDDRNPYSRAYGVGYTGQSFGWVEEQVSLDMFVGQDILLRFEVITDAASIRHGMAIDDLRIDAIGYAESFEDGPSAWAFEGWIATDNQLPRQAWVQAVQIDGNELTVSRWLSVSANDTWTIDLLPTTDTVLIAVSPITPQTMLESDYVLNVSVTP